MMLGFLGQRKRVHFYFVPRPDPSILWRKRGASLSGLERRGNELRAAAVRMHRVVHLVEDMLLFTLM